MASSEADLARLTQSQQLALQTYISVTNQDPAASIPLLERSEWNVQIAIAKYFDGEASDPVAEAHASFPNSATAQRENRRETLLDGSVTPRSSRQSSDLDVAPRIVPQPSNQVAYQPPLLVALFFTPFSFLYRFLTRALGFVGILLPFLPRLLSGAFPSSGPRTSQRDTTGRRPLNPRDTAARFIREFEEEYGSHALRFFEDGYAQALDMAKRDLKFLLVVLVSPEHDDNSSFIRETLLSPDVVEYINNPTNNIILWAGNVQDSEAYQVSNALRCTKFPFSAVIAQTARHPSTSLSVVSRIAGPTSSTAYLAKLGAAVTQYSGGLQQARVARAEQEASRNLREEQNSAYQRSLAQDRERARQKREAEAAKARAALETQERLAAKEKRAQDLLQWKRWRARSIPAESSVANEEAIRISVRMSSGERVVRKFASDAKVEDIYAYVECYDILPTVADKSTATPPADYEHAYMFRLVSPMPRKVYEPSAEGTLREHFGRSGSLIVESIEDDDEVGEGN